MRALVTGAAGFIGSTLVERLLEQDAQIGVIGIDSMTTYYDPAIKRSNIASALSHPRFTFIEDDLNRLDLGGLLDGIDVIFHQAGQPGVRSSWGIDFNAYIASNIQATQSLLEAARDSRTLSRFVYASSSSIYGNAEVFPTKETANPQPQSPYGVTKLSAEHLCSLYADNFEVPTVSLRYFTVFGPRQRPDMAFQRFLNAAKSGDSIPLNGDGTQIRDFTYVDDIVRANMLAAFLPDIPPGAVMNLSGGSSTSMLDVLDMMREVVGLPLPVNTLSPVAGDVNRTGGSSEVARHILGWEPMVDLHTGLERQWEHVKKSTTR